MKDEQLAGFVALVEESHFGRAAARLGISASSFSKSIQNLERELGLRLFSRTSRRVMVTPEALPLIERARGLVRDLDGFREAAAHAAAGTTGRIRLLYGIRHAELVADLTSALAERHPGLILDFVQQGNGEIPLDVANRAASLGLCWGRLPAGLASLRFAEVLFDTVFVPVNHPLAGRSIIELADLAGSTFIKAGPDPRRCWPGLDISVRRLPLGGRDELATRVESGQGLVLTTSATVNWYGHRRLVPVRLADPNSWVRIDQLLVWRADDKSPATHHVIETVRALAPAA